MANYLNRSGPLARSLASRVERLRDRPIGQIVDEPVRVNRRQRCRRIETGDLRLRQRQIPAGQIVLQLVQLPLASPPANSFDTMRSDEITR
jgi:hypothetical protein